MRRKWEFFRLGVLSFQRLGLLPGLGLLLAFLLLIQGTAIYCLVETEKRQPIALTAVCGQNGDRLCDLLREADGVEKTAIAIAFSAQLYLDENRCELTLYGVDSSWLDIPLKGNLYPGESAMPWIVLNQNAMGAFSNEKGEMIKAEEVSWQETSIDVNGLVGKICGIVNDDRAEACGYVSVRMAKYLIQNEEGNSKDYYVFIRLKEASCAGKITEILEKQGASLTGSRHLAEEQWKQNMYRARLNLLSAFAIFVLAVALIVEKTRRDYIQNQAEYQFLMEYGADRRAIGLLLAARTVPLIFISIIGAVIIQLLLKI